MTHNHQQPTGYRKSALNATRHGMSARTLLLPGESAEALEDLRAALQAQYQPQTSMEHLMFEEVVATMWRMQRLRRVERAVYQNQERQRAENSVFEIAIGGLLRVNGTELRPDEEQAEILRRTVISEDSAKLLRFDSHLCRRLVWALGMLERLQQGRRESEENSKTIQIT